MNEPVCTVIPQLLHLLKDLSVYVQKLHLATSFCLHFTKPAIAVKFTIINLIFLCSITIKTSTTTSSNDPWSSQPDNSDLRVIPQYGKDSPFKSNSDSWARPNMIMNMATNDLERVQYLSSLVHQEHVPNVPVPSLPSFHLNNYLVQVKFGTPGQQMLMVLDTSHDKAWGPCTNDPSTSGIFSPNSSLTIAGPIDCSSTICSQVRGSVLCSGPRVAPCFFNQSYGDSNFSAVLIQDSLTSANIFTIPNYAFGCIISVSGASFPAQGLLGLGRGPLSLLSQTIPYFNGVFSYCLPSFNSPSFSGSLFFGPADQPSEIPTTPLLRNSHRPSLYYVNITRITVGKVHMAFSSDCVAFDPNTRSGTIIDLGMVVTRFVEPIYSAIRNEFREQVKGPFRPIGEFDTCFANTIVPLITLHFTNLELTLPIENTIIDSGSWACLAIAAMPNDKTCNLNVIGSFQQQNLRILFDTVNSMVGIGQELCS